jgi:hypothetical protein
VPPVSNRSHVVAEATPAMPRARVVRSIFGRGGGAFGV